MLTQAPVLNHRQLILVTITLCLASLLFVLDYAVASVILPYVIGDLGARYEQGAYIITSFSIGNAFSIPPIFFLTKYFGERRLLFYTLMLFPLASFWCGITNSFPVLLIFRFILGFISGPILPVALFLLLDLYPKKLHDTVFGVWACTMITAPMIGPVIGGYLCTEYSWRMAFLIAIPIGILCGLFLRYELGLETKREKVPFDMVGYLLLCTVSVTAQFINDKGQQWDWYRSNLVLFLAFTCLLALCLFIAWSWKSLNPILDFAFLRKPSFVLALVILILTYSSFFGSIIVIPIWLETMMGYDAFKAGMAIAPIGIIPVLVAPFNAILIKKFGIRPLLFASMCAFAAVSYYTTNFYIDVDLFHIQMSRLFLGIGFAIYLAPLLSLGLEEMSEEEKPKALVFFHYIRVTAGAIGAGCFSTIFSRRTYFHHEFMTEFVNQLNPYLEPFTRAIKRLPFPSGKPIAVIGQAVEQQAKVLALLDVFWVIMWMYILAALAIVAWWIVPKIIALFSEEKRDDAESALYY
ncbi:MAG: DHA2 family efflux MFS transporter permease subunit [Chlamydiia bacterium]